MNKKINTALSTRGRNSLNYSALCVFTGITALLSGIAFNAKAQNAPDWWFDVELLIVKHEQVATAQTEVFPQNSANKLEYGFALMSDFLQPDVNAVAQHLPECDEFGMLQTLCKPAPTFVDFLAEWLVNSKTDEEKSPLNKYETLPIYYNGYVPYRSTQPHFLPKSSLTLSSLYADMRWDKTMTPLLHVAWRQPVAEGEDNATFYRIQAGENLSYTMQSESAAIHTLFANDVLNGESVQQTISENETPLNQFETNNAGLSSANSTATTSLFNKSLVAQIKENLAAPADVKYTQNEELQTIEEATNSPVFEIDGGLKIFIKYYSGVPYLHVVGDMLFANKDPDTGQIAFHAFQQRRRVISKQVHYFDHPNFGLVVTLTRHKRPAPQE